MITARYIRGNRVGVAPLSTMNTEVFCQNCEMRMIYRWKKLPDTLCLIPQWLLTHSRTPRHVHLWCHQQAKLSQQRLTSVTKETKGDKTPPALLRQKSVPTYTPVRSSSLVWQQELNKRASTDMLQFCLELPNLPEVDVTEL